MPVIRICSIKCNDYTDTSAQCFAKQHEQQHVPKVRLLTIWFGANDACIPPSAQHIPLPKFISNLTHLVRMVTSPSSPYYSPSTRIILITPPPVNTYQRAATLQAKNPPMLLDRSFETTRKYAEAVIEIGEKEGIPVIDIWTALFDAAGRDERALSRFLWDGLHLNAAGYEVSFLVLDHSSFGNHPMPVIHRYYMMPSSKLFATSIPSFITTDSNPYFRSKY